MSNRQIAIGGLSILAALLLMLAGLVAQPTGAATPTVVVDSDIVEWQNPVELLTVTFPLSSSLSGPVRLNGLSVIGYIMPSTWDAADLTFRASVDDTTYNNIYTDGDSEYTVQAAKSRYIIADSIELRGINYLMVRSGTSGSAVNQENGLTAQTLQLVLKATD